MSPLSAPHPTASLRRDVGLHLAFGGAAVAVGGLMLGRALVLPPTYAAVCLAVFLLVAGSALTRLTEHAPNRRWGDANRVTLARGVLISLLGGALAAVEALDAVALWLFSAMAATALALDGVDGWVARRQGTASPYGARFDMGLDTLLTLVLALMLWRGGEAGVWVLLAGLLRHLFVAAALAFPWMAAPLPPSGRRRAICVIQIAALVAGLTPAIAPPLSGLAAGAALALLLFSFATDTVWLHRNARRPLSTG